MGHLEGAWSDHQFITIVLWAGSTIISKHFDFVRCAMFNGWSWNPHLELGHGL